LRQNEGVTPLPPLPAGVSLAQLNYGQLLLDGGFTNLFIGILSVVALATVLERLVNLRSRRIVSARAITAVRAQWQTATASAFEEFCRADGSVFARAAVFISQHRDRDFPSVSTAVSDLASVEIRRHHQRVYPLALVATITPLAGLFGTVIGIVETFNGVAETGHAGNVSLLAAGIYKALSTTAAGLLVAIPALGFYHYFRMRIRSSALLLEEGLNGLLNDYVLRANR
jgi:biopolymer transport protein ExbB